MKTLQSSCLSPPSHLLTSILSPGYRQLGRLPGQLLHPVHLITPVHTATHHPRQPQGLNFLHGAGERDRPLPPPLPCPAQVASAPLSAHLSLRLLLLLPPLPRAFRSGLMFQLCVSIRTLVTFDVAFHKNREKEREKT